MAERETGVQSAPCRNCGTELAAVEQPDGATAYEVCNKCYKQPKKSDIRAAEKAAAEMATTPREVGTDTTQEENS